MNELWYVLIQRWDDNCGYDSEVAFFLSKNSAISYAIECAFKFGVDYQDYDYDVKVEYGVGRYEFIDIDVRDKDSGERAAWERYAIGKVVPKESGEQKES